MSQMKITVLRPKLFFFLKAKEAAVERYHRYAFIINSEVVQTNSGTFQELILAEQHFTNYI